MSDAPGLGSTSDETTVSSSASSEPAVLASPAKLRIVATSTASGNRTVFRDWSDGDDLLACLRAGASMPIVGGPPFPYRLDRYWDARLSEPIPATVAEEEGCTHLVVLLTRPSGAAGPRVSLTERLRSAAEPIERARVAAQIRDLAEEIIEASVRQANRDGVTWREIGAGLDIPFQTLFRRYGAS